MQPSHIRNHIKEGDIAGFILKVIPAIIVY